MYVVLKDLFFDKMVAASLKLLSGMESTSIPSNEHASTTKSNANSSSIKAKCDPTWDHLTKELKDRKVVIDAYIVGKFIKEGASIG